MPSKTARHWPTSLSYFAIFVALGMGTASLGPTLSGLAEQTSTELDAISFLFTAHALGYMFGSFFGGRLYDRMPGHSLMAGMLALMAGMMALIPLAPTLWVLAIAWFLQGISGGALDVGGNTLIVWVHGRNVGPFMNALHFFFGIGSFLAPVIVGQALTLSGGISWAYWILALLVLPVALWLLRVPSPSSPSRTPHDAHQSGSSEEDALRSERQQTTTGIGKVVLLIALLLLFYVGAEASFGGWIHTYAIALDLNDAATAAYLTSAFWGALTFGRLVSIPLAARYRPRSILLADLLGCLASVGIVLLWPASPVAVWLGALGLGLAMASVFPTAISLAERRIPITGQVTGWFLVAASTGAMSVPWLIGQLFEPLGPPSAMWVILLDLIAGLLVLGLLLRIDTPTLVSSEEEEMRVR